MLVVYLIGLIFFIIINKCDSRKYELKNANAKEYLSKYVFSLSGTIEAKKYFTRGQGDYLVNIKRLNTNSPNNYILSDVEDTLIVFNQSVAIFGCGGFYEIEIGDSIYLSTNENRIEIFRNSVSIHKEQFYY